MDENKNVEYGAEVPAYNYEVADGYTFSGWQGLPETMIMPAEDVTATGTFSINSYLLNIYVDDTLYSSEEVEYGTVLVIEVPELPEDREFDKWLEEIPETMPAHDLDLHAVTKEKSYVRQIGIDNDTTVTVYSMEGRKLYERERWFEVQKRLADGIYIINGRTYMIRRR